MEIFSLVCQEIDDFEKSVGTSMKNASRSILNEYKDIVEDEDFTSFTSELSKLFSKNRKRTAEACQGLFQNEEIVKARDQYMKEIEKINKKAKEFNKALKQKGKENRPAYSNREEGSQKMILVPKKKLQELDINSLKKNIHHQTHLKIQSRFATIIQRAFRAYLERKKEKGSKKTKGGKQKEKSIGNKGYDEKKVIKVQSLVRGFLAKRKFIRLKKIDLGVRKLDESGLKESVPAAFGKIMRYWQIRSKLLKRAGNLLKYTDIVEAPFSALNRDNLKVITKVDGKYKMAESFYMSYRRSQIFYAWLLLAARRKLK